MKDFCTCKEWEYLKESFPDFFQLLPSYGWVISYLTITEEGRHSRLHKYGIPIEFCPLCGKKLKIE